MNSTARRITFAAVILCIAVPLMVVNSCAFEPESDLFYKKYSTPRPQQFAAGELGLLQAGYYTAEKFAAYRYLSGGALDAAEQRGWNGYKEEPVNWDSLTPEEMERKQAEIQNAQNNTPIANWNKLRATFQPAPAKEARQTARMEIWEQRDTGQNFIGSIINCNDPAFATAVETLKDRAAKWGNNSPLLKDWLVAQDAVFSNCEQAGDTPQPAANADALLKQDRAYQIAATQFYRAQYDDAAKSFLEIASDKTSPWSRWGEYLAARAIVRKAAMLSTKNKDDFGLAIFDKPTLARAGDMLRRVAANRDVTVAHAAAAELGYVEARLDGKKRSEVLAVAIAGPAHDTNYEQDVADLRFLTLNGITGDAPLLKWLALTGTPMTTEARTRSASATEQAGLAADSLSQWHKDPSLPWLVAALMNASAAGDDLLAAAARVPKTSPGYITVQYHRSRLLIAAHRNVAARMLLTEVLAVAKSQHDDSAANSLLALRTQTATDFDSMLADLPRKQIANNLYYGCGKPKCPTLPSTQFDADGAQIFNRALPLRLWLAAARNPNLPQNLREAVAMAGWTRAYSLQDKEALKEFAVMVKPNLPADAGFDATFFVLHSSKLLPYLEQGTQATATYQFSPSLAGGSWWCQKSDKQGLAIEGWEYGGIIPIPDFPFLTAGDKAASAKEIAILDANALGIPLIGRRAMDYIRVHPDDPRAPEALARIVVATHYGCSRQDKGPTSAISKEAFTLLHKNYPKSEWAAKTKYYY